MTTLGDAFPQEQARVRALLGEYTALGPVGMYGAAVIEDVLRRADTAVIEGDVVAMIVLYKELQDCQ